MAVIPVRHNIDPADVYVRIVCTETGKRFRVNLKGATTNTICRCAQEGWKIKAQPLPGFLNVQLFHVDKWGNTDEVELESTDVILDEDGGE